MPTEPAALPDRVLLRCGSSATRLAHALEWLVAFPPATEVVVVGASLQAADDLLRQAVLASGAAYGWQRMTPGRLAAGLAQRGLMSSGRVPIGPLAAEAMVARIAHGLRDRGALGRYQRVVDGPGFARAIAAALLEVRMAGLDSAAIRPVAPELATLLDAYSAEMARENLADRAETVRLATQLLDDASAQHPLLGRPLLLLDVPAIHVLEADLFAGLIRRSGRTLITQPIGDERTLQHLRTRLALDPIDIEQPPSTSLERLQVGLFRSHEARPLVAQHNVDILSAPGEAREAVEIARRVLRLARGGMPFDRMAVLLRSVEEYRPHLEQAFHRAGIEAWFARGVRRPDPSGRAFLALLACREEGLSARRFAEYLSLAQVPELAVDGAPPEPAPAGERAVPPDDDLLPASIADSIGSSADREPEHAGLVDPEAAPVRAGALRTPRRWERLLVDAAVIGGIDRWRRRLDGLAAELRLKLEIKQQDADAGGSVAGLQADLSALDHLRRFALPLLGELEALPAAANWDQWLRCLSQLAARALKDPDRVEATLTSLAQLGAVGPVRLAEVRLVLAPHLLELQRPPGRNRMGQVFVAPVEAARGMAFDAVFVPGLAERMFPRRIAEEPILLDHARRHIRGGDGDASPLRTNDDRVTEERLLLRLAAGAARSHLVLSYPRLDLDQARPRVPSFYALEAMRAAEGSLPGFDELARRAETITEARVGWPAPRNKRDAIDEAEYDLALLEGLLRDGQASDGTARYLVTANPHLGRALRARARRWLPNWNIADGLVDPGEGAKAALASHQLAARSFSPTALQNFAQCPYRFFLQAVLRLEKREPPEAIEEIDPLNRGSLVHDAVFELLTRLRDLTLLPVTQANLGQVQALLEDVLDQVAGQYEDRLAPAIPKVWSDGIASIRADLREWLRRMALDRSHYVPWRFELAFGLKIEDRAKIDPHSTEAAVALDCGIRLRGSIDLVEKTADGHLRVTDHKTGKVKVSREQRIAGGQSLQAVLYALAIEKLFPDLKVDSGRLYYCTSAGGFEDREVVLDTDAREAARHVATTIGQGLTQPFLPAAPAEQACLYCDYKVVCGAHEEDRVRRKSQKSLNGLASLRKQK